MHDDADYALLVGLMAGLVRGDPGAKWMFEQADFRESILFRERKLPGSLPSQPQDADPEELTEPDPADLLHWISARGRTGGRDAIDRIREFLAGAERVTWCDPYLLGGELSETFDGPDNYADTIAEVISSSVRHLRVFTLDRPKVPKPGADPKQATLVWRRLKEGRQLELVKTKEVHDRYILRDGKAGLMVGGSFGGLGGKYCTILPLPSEDVTTLYQILNGIASAP
ncbi:hypothetical protein [Novosphingobium beihaiensis]|uniref:Uncharacterized protein n=1 Tax=Novosphingobium beihaiensis TaxID=2930389 RepID=A0ABT0BT66_9SPHN|nr:hypothetical protein [Novosphingobium beihaiensis]MCJ2188222.1 hypothetical protein [Novosphingobium beihaiensis]